MESFIEALNIDAISLSIATGFATLLVFLLKMLFSLLRRIAKKTPSGLDDNVVEQAEKMFREKSRDI